jgi:hypothetical protein
MAVPRVEWECPVCHRHFAIRTDMPRPSACPQCSTDGGTAAEPTVIAGADSRREFKAGTVGMLEQPAIDPGPAVEPDLSVPAGTVRQPERYRALLVMSLCFKAFAALAAVAGIAALTLMVLAAFRMQNPETRTAAILLHLARFAGSAFATLALWCIAELIQLLIDIEANTRRARS